MKKEKALRIVIDAMIQGVILIGSSRNLALAKTNLERSKMFLGQVLKEQGEENPYPNSMDSSNAKIEPTADVAPEENELILALKKLSEENKPGIALTVKQIKELRRTIEEVLSEMRSLIDDQEPGYELMWKKESFIALTEAKMWLGMELGEINKKLNGMEPINQPTTTSDLPATNSTAENPSLTNEAQKDDNDPSGDRA